MRTRDLSAILTSLLLLSFQSVQATEKTGSLQNKTNTLQGGVAQDVALQLRAQQRALGFEVDKSAGTVTVSKVYPGSSAFYRGLRAGDQILESHIAEKYGFLEANINIKRAGQAYSLNLHTQGDYQRYLDEAVRSSQSNLKPAPAAASNLATSTEAAESASGSQKATAAAEANSSHIAVSVGAEASAQSSVRLQGNAVNDDNRARAERALRTRDLYVLIDRSGSMETTDCPGAMSRWQWCRDQVTTLSKDTEAVLPEGFTLVLFNNHSKFIAPANAASIREAFLSNKPDGGTDIAGALTKVFNDYRERKSKGSAKPLLVTVITDGVPNDERSLRRLLTSISGEMSRSEEITVVFLQVGEDNQASAYLEDLDRNLVSEGAHFDIAESLMFTDLKSLGLLNALGRCVK